MADTSRCSFGLRCPLPVVLLRRAYLGRSQDETLHLRFWLRAKAVVSSLCGRRGRGLRWGSAAMEGGSPKKWIGGTLVDEGAGREVARRHDKTVEECPMRSLSFSLAISLSLAAFLPAGASAQGGLAARVAQLEAQVEAARVFDGEGRDVGAFVDVVVLSGSPQGLPALWRVLLADSGVIGLVNTWTGLLDYPVRIFFDLPDCQGRGYVPPYFSNTLIHDPRFDDSWLVGSTSEFWFGVVVVQSTLQTDGSCDNHSRPVSLASAMVSVEKFDKDLGITFPLPLPLWIGSSSSDSP
jgi:hypothetical protein